MDDIAGLQPLTGLLHMRTWAQFRSDWIIFLLHPHADFELVLSIWGVVLFKHLRMPNLRMWYLRFPIVLGSGWWARLISQRCSSDLFEESLCANRRKQLFLLFLGVSNSLKLPDNRIVMEIAALNNFERIHEVSKHSFHVIILLVSVAPFNQLLVPEALQVFVPGEVDVEALYAGGEALHVAEVIVDPIMAIESGNQVILPFGVLAVDHKHQLFRSIHLLVESLDQQTAATLLEAEPNRSWLKGVEVTFEMLIPSLVGVVNPPALIQDQTADHFVGALLGAKIRDGGGRNQPNWLAFQAGQFTNWPFVPSASWISCTPRVFLKWIVLFIWWGVFFIIVSLGFGPVLLFDFLLLSCPPGTLLSWLLCALAHEYYCEWILVIGDRQIVYLYSNEGHSISVIPPTI